VASEEVHGEIAHGRSVDQLGAKGIRSR
jgi:hypothetical protein